MELSIVKYGKATKPWVHPMPRKGAGFTLLEVLVALIVLSIGLLGLSGLQTMGLRNNHSAFMRSQATLFAGNIIDHMRANRGAAMAGDYNIDFADDAPTTAVCTTNCSRANVADMDLQDWLAALQRINGDGEIDVVQETAVINGETVTYDMAVVSVCWRDQRGADLDCTDALADRESLLLVTRSQL